MEKCQKLTKGHTFVKIMDIEEIVGTDCKSVWAVNPTKKSLLWFFGDFRCGVQLFIVILVLNINIKIGKIDVKC